MSVNFRNKLRGYGVVIPVLHAFSGDICKNCIGLDNSRIRVVKGLKKLRTDLEKSNLLDIEKKELLTSTKRLSDMAEEIRVAEECECQKTPGNCKIGIDCFTLDGVMELMKQITEEEVITVSKVVNVSQACCYDSLKNLIEDPLNELKPDEVLEVTVAPNIENMVKEYIEKNRYPVLEKAQKENNVIFKIKPSWERARVEKHDFGIESVTEAYDGAAGVIWEMVMGEFIHVGGKDSTMKLAEKTGVTKDTRILDVCSALGAPARFLAKTYGCRVDCLDACTTMLQKAMDKTKEERLSHMVTYKQGNALDMPYRSRTFDVVWGEDAWCYITDKKRLIEECARVIKPGGSLAFTDWIQAGYMSEKERKDLNSFMIFPYMETIEGYSQLIRDNGFDLITAEKDAEFAKYMHTYQDKLKNELKDAIVKLYNKELYKYVEDGVGLWVKAADEGKVDKGWFIAKKKP